MIFRIPPGSCFVFEVNMSENWEGVPDFVKFDEQKIGITAIYEVAKGKTAIEKGVWTGRLTSPTINVIIHPPIKPVE